MSGFSVPINVSRSGRLIENLQLELPELFDFLVKFSGMQFADAASLRGYSSFSSVYPRFYPRYNPSNHRFIEV